MGELLLELLSEEIPARMQRRAIEDLATHLDEWLRVHRIPAERMDRYVTPRRLTVIAYGIPERQPSGKEERRGPRLGSPQQAVDGFLRSVGIATVDQCEVRATDRGEFYFAVLEQPGYAAADVLPDLIYSTICDVAWPKSMRFPAAELRWVRPLASAICLFDGEVVPLALGAVPVGRTTRGHRFLSPGEISVKGAADYLAKLEQAHVVLDWGRRRELIDAGLKARASADGLTVKPDAGLLDEVTGLVEYPVVLAGSIDADFVRPLPDGLPPEVLATAMRTHQKYFSCLNADGTPAPRFLFVANNKTADGGKAIAAGNERVLRARLADARFFWDQDRKIRLEDRVEALKQRVYHEKLGSVYDKVERVEKLAEYLTQFVTPAEAGVQVEAAERSPLDSRVRGNDELKGLAQRAAHLCKADLSTGMVGEFPELQGVMGRYYALNDGEDPRVADAIADHYKPLGPSDTCPTTPVSVVVALADKIDTLAAFFAVGEPPTGSRDPFALRRAALGAIRLILENKLRFDLNFVCGHAVNLRERGLWDPIDREVVTDFLTDFIINRLEVHLREHGIHHDLINAIFFLAEYDLMRLLARVEALQKFLDTEDGANLLIAYRRAANIVAIEEKRDGLSYNGPVDPTRLEPGGADERLWQSLQGMETVFSPYLAAERFGQAMSRLATLRRPVDEFFDKVTVNVEDRALRENRLRLLSRIRATMNLVADFSQIEG